MSVKWNEFNVFNYFEYGDGRDFLYSEVDKSYDVVLPGGKAVEVKKGDYLLVDMAGTEVFVLEKAKTVAKVKEVVKETLIVKVKKFAKKEKTKKAKKAKPVLEEVPPNAPEELVKAWAKEQSVLSKDEN